MAKNIPFSPTHSPPEETANPAARSLDGLPSTNPLDELLSMPRAIGVINECHRMLNSLLPLAAEWTPPLAPGTFPPYDTPESVRLSKHERAELYREQSYMNAFSGPPSLSDSGYTSTSSTNEDKTEPERRGAGSAILLQSSPPSVSALIDNYEKVSAWSANDPMSGPPPLQAPIDNYERRGAGRAILLQSSPPSMPALNDHYDKISAVSAWSANEPMSGPPPLPAPTDNYDRRGAGCATPLQSSPPSMPALNDHYDKISAMRTSSANRPTLGQPPPPAHIDTHDHRNATSSIVLQSSSPSLAALNDNHDKISAWSANEPTSGPPAPPRQPHLGVMPAPTFNGRNWESFKLRFIACADANDWDDGDRLKVLAASLRGDAVFMLQQKPADCEWTCHSLLAHLDQRYGVNELKWMQRSVLAGTKQGPDQSIHEYADTLYRMAARIDTDARARDTLILSAFLDGIDDPEMSRYLKLPAVMLPMHVQTMNDAVKLARHYEAWREYSHPRDGPSTAVSNAPHDLSGPYINRGARRARKWNNNPRRPNHREHRQRGGPYPCNQKNCNIQARSAQTDNYEYEATTAQPCAISPVPSGPRCRRSPPRLGGFC